ncbi:MAG: hypothetical protein GXX85_09380 [Ignavibacteria bacterium]|nr:hypothetical protein [Ignavibacteria bacterium]
MKTLKWLFFLWFLANAVCLYLSGYFLRIANLEIGQGTRNFFLKFYTNADVYFPIQSLEIQHYDLTEFVLYVIIPWLVYLIVERYTT